MINPKLPAILYGGDYNPDQWPEEIWREDMRLFRLAGINVVVVPVFSWAKLQPAEDRYDFEWLDRVLDLLAENGIYACIATSTAAQPAWMSVKYPEILPVDVHGRKRTHGKRVNFCPNSKVYREFAARLARKLAERYKDHPALLYWRVANEYGTYCYCDTCAQEFRKWVQKRYGTIEEVNRRWNLSFWGHTIHSWDEIMVPSELNDDNKWYQPVALDYLRFMTDSTIECFVNEYQAIKEVTPDLMVSTNISGYIKKLDQFKFAEYVDIVSWDNYPQPQHRMSLVAFKHDLMRGLKGGRPYILAEQTPSSQNWQPYNLLKRPGVMRLLSYQALARGADTVMFFQMRQSKAGVEKLHGAVISHAGHERTRVFRECAQLGAELKNIGASFLDSRVTAKVAVMFDWDNWWAVELSSGPSRDLQYLDQVEKYYHALWKLNVPVDIVRPDSDLSKYDLVLAPLLYMTKPGTAENIENYVREGGTFVTTFFSGMVDENDHIILGGYPGELKDVLGIWVEEIDGLLPEMKNGMVMKGPLGELNGTYECGLICDLLHLRGAEALAVYAADFYAGRPCLTRNQFGKGTAYYVASDPEQPFIDGFVKYLCDLKGIKAPLEVPPGVEVTQREKESRRFTFVLNHNETAVEIDLGEKACFDLVTQTEKRGRVRLAGRDVLILEEQQSS
ncbi:MAG TPA: beta-galactosidase [Limnochordia bacterium]|nr:beta-galactosidase [Limnochordia bacterium]HPT93683.1 beta-galactosidase [Limnochordia bacterium]HQD71179.1 beta-galactosidase [Limnochordia bacterium]HXK96532.1 beta-galactosidase [Limnochordia bacterium]